MHKWGDEDVDWNGINDAAEYIANFCKRWARLGGSYKEKYGTVRFYVQWSYGLLSLTHPGYMHYGPYPKWLMHFDISYGYLVLKYTGLTWFLGKWQPFIYRLAYKNAVKKWPHLREEILSGADYTELLTGI